MKLIKYKQKAFTLIELLIVIAILGILAVGILVGINPLEQTRKATDTSLVRIASEYKTAVDRFYAGHNYMPWCDPSSAPGTCNAPYGAGCANFNALTSTAGEQLGTGCNNAGINALIISGELKSTFLSSAGNNAQVIRVWSDAAGAVYIGVGFDPKSNSYDTNTNTNLPDNVGCVDGGTAVGFGQPCGTSGTQGTSPNSCLYCIR